MNRWALALLCLVALWSEGAAARCAMPAGWNAVVKPQAHFVVFGETHGSAQSPTLFGQTACALAERREHVLIAVELSENAGLQRAWTLPHARFAEALVREMPEWRTRDDGVTSQAMLAMLVRLHGLKAAGRVIDVVAFNDTRQAERDVRFKDLPGQGPHEAGQAENIRIADALRPHDRVLVLVGSYHARKKALAPRGVTYEPMAMRLAEPARVVSLYLAHGPGKSWNCTIKGAPPASGPITSDMIECGAHGGGADVDWQGPPRIVDTSASIGAANPDGAYDATFFIGPITASPPIARAP